MNLSQAEIDAMMAGNPIAAEPEEAPADESATVPAVTLSTSYEAPPDGELAELTDIEVDILGEVGNMCMGAVATTMYTLLDHRVDITTPRVSISTTAQVIAEYTRPFVMVEVEYVEGISGRNFLLLKEEDAALITDLLMGGDGTVVEPIELTELHMSAMNEIMNQMIAASATALSQLLVMPINISTPTSQHMEISTEIDENPDYLLPIIRTDFNMEIEGVLSSKLIQIMPYEQGIQLAQMLFDMHTGTGDEPPAVAEAPVAEAPAPAPAPAAPPAPQTAPPAPPPAQPYAPPPEMQQQYYQPPPGYAPAPQYYQQPAPAYGQYPQCPFPPQEKPVPGDLVDVRPMQFASFDEGVEDITAHQGGIDVVYNIPLQVSAELGTATKNLSEILDLEEGSVIVLNKLAGDPVEVMINGKKIARGEVVVIEDNYGVRITEMPDK